MIMINIQFPVSQKFIWASVLLTAFFLLVTNLFIKHNTTPTTIPTNPARTIHHHTNVFPLNLQTPYAATRTVSEVIYKANFTAPVINMNEVTIIIKTMDRPACLHTLVTRIHQWSPNITVLVADDGFNSSAHLLENTTNVKYFRMPYDCGLSAGRNLLVSQVDTMYLLMLEDDFLWNDHILEHFMHVQQLHPYLDIVGGKAGFDFAGTMHVANSTLFMVKDSKSVLEGTARPIKSNIESITQFEMGPPCVLVDFTPNFIFAKTASLLQSGWDNDLKVGEHEEFFLRFKKKNLQVAYCVAIYVENQQSRCNDETDASKWRQVKRSRARSYIKRALSTHKISRLAYCLGEDFSSITGDVIPGPTNEICHEIPLPQLCPTGRMGTDCNECAPGFTGEQCDQCLPYHYGVNCIPCKCANGTCVVTPDGNDQSVRCDCDPGWYGSTCNTQLQLGENLVSDPYFLSLYTNVSGQWRNFKDGCFKWADNGIWLTNNGSLSCGAYFILEINQTIATPIVISVESKGMDVEASTDISTYSLYIDIHYRDGGALWGQVINFPDGTHNMQQKEAVAKLKRPVKSITAYVLLGVKGRAFFTNLRIRQQSIT